MKGIFRELIIKGSEVSDLSIPNIESKNKQSRLLLMRRIFSDAHNFKITGSRFTSEKVCLRKICSDPSSEQLDSFWQNNFLMKNINSDTKND
jgi:hypothetical protein